RTVDASTILDKFMVGYQGWFTCAGDGQPHLPEHHGWQHWVTEPPSVGGRPTIDTWPDIASYSNSELYTLPGIGNSAGEPVRLFSSRNPLTVQRHFHWMAEYGVDGAFLQRFLSEVDVAHGKSGTRRIRDEVTNNVRIAAESMGRAFAIMYDVSSVAPNRIQSILEQDYEHLMNDLKVFDSPNYLHQDGRPFLGFGFESGGHTPQLTRSVVQHFRAVASEQLYLIAGTPAYWRMGIVDAEPDPDFLDVWLNEFDAISPWTVGRYIAGDDADYFSDTIIAGDLELLEMLRLTTGRDIHYMPVMFPGLSGYNLSGGKWPFNDISRDGGYFLWQQIYNVRKQGIRMMYGAMWDEYDEGTALMPVAASQNDVPLSNQFPFMALDEDGYELPSDWFMRICAFGAESVHDERMISAEIPAGELLDYWLTYAHYPVEMDVTGHNVTTEYRTSQC
ncbi:hypothetical protein FISHEDRAFT_49223, partial [Fistulina hepatica ATCC 64428]